MGKYLDAAKSAESRLVTFVGGADDGRVVSLDQLELDADADKQLAIRVHSDGSFELYELCGSRLIYRFCGDVDDL